MVNPMGKNSPFRSEMWFPKEGMGAAQSLHPSCEHLPQGTVQLGAPHQIHTLPQCLIKPAMNQNRWDQSYLRDTHKLYSSAEIDVFQ